MTGNQFKEIRERIDVTQEEIAAILCRSISTIRVWELGANLNRHIIDELTSYGIIRAIEEYEKTGQAAVKAFDSSLRNMELAQ